MGLHFIGCPHALDNAPAIREAGGTAWWIDKGAGASALQRAPYALLQAAKAFSQGREEGFHDRAEQDRKGGGK